jgi:tetratricopeptide (TPR) repeat protein
LYLSTIVTAENRVELYLAIARCHFEAREFGIAVDYAQRVLDREPANVAARELRAEGRYRRREHEDALVACGEWIDAAPAAGQPHYLRAKILLALGRFSEARDECDRATELSPSHLPAMLLRRQLVRSIRRVRAAAGKPLPAPIDLPEHLRDLRALLVAGQTAEAIALLETPEHAADPQAQLLRADLLLFTDQLDAALAAFEKVGGLAGGLGQATVLVRMNRAEDALALCDALVREQPAAAEPHEGRAAALQALGRTAEADEAYKHALAANAQRSQVRVRLGRG